MSDTTEDAPEINSTESDGSAADDVQHVLTVTPGALTKVLEIRDAEDDPEGTALQVQIVGTRGVEYDYDLSLEPIAELAEDADTTTFEGLTVSIPVDSVEDMRGATLDLPSNPMQGGLVIRNPNRPPVLAATDVDLSGTVPEMVQQLLDQSINPALAAHGGFASLVKVDDAPDDKSIVHVLMGGGCQGCSMSAMTLSEGIKTAIMDAIPAVIEVIDATDHTAGENPFYS